ncbi:MAG: helix-turn-helix transcriptional regulator [Candidatus Thorarchaeota archaeon]
MVERKHAFLIVVFLMPILVSVGITQVSAQAASLDLIMSNMTVTAIMENECAASLYIDSDVTNVGSAVLDYFDLRVDVRSLNVSSARLNGSTASTRIIPESNYNLIRITSSFPIPVNSTIHMNLNISTDCLQEQIGLNDDETMYVNHLIYYIRPLYQIQNLTFTAILPTHAILQTDAAAPLFPNPTLNFTDGFRPIYVWYRASLLPGQEVAYIVKYQLPAAIVEPQPSPINAILFGAVFLIIGAVVAVVVERIPLILQRLQTRKIITPVRLSKQEEQVLNFLTKKGGSCPQREIYEELDMSQSLASTILTALEERKLIRRFREGRENMVHIMEESDVTPTS